jgi:hypothetical protein
LAERAGALCRRKSLPFHSLLAPPRVYITHAQGIAHLAAPLIPSAPAMRDCRLHTVSTKPRAGLPCLLGGFFACPLPSTPRSHASGRAVLVGECAPYVSTHAPTPSAASATAPPCACGVTCARGRIDECLPHLLSGCGGPFHSDRPPARTSRRRNVPAIKRIPLSRTLLQVSCTGRPAALTDRRAGRAAPRGGVASQPDLM